MNKLDVVLSLIKKEVVDSYVIYRRSEIGFEEVIGFSDTPKQVQELIDEHVRQNKLHLLSKCRQDRNSGVWSASYITNWDSKFAGSFRFEVELFVWKITDENFEANLVLASPLGN